MNKAIIVNHLQKNFEVIEREKGIVNSISSVFNPTKKTIRALKDVSFTIQKGELVGFIGPNGAGKTTTLKVLSGLLYPTSGFVSVMDFNPWEKSPDFLKQISLVMGHKNQLWWDLPAIESFELNKEIYELSDREYDKNLTELVNLLDVGKLLKTPVRKLSLGQRMRMELIASLIYKPQVLFLDEPTLGLDIVAQQNLRDFIYEYNKRNEATVLLTSHNMDDLTHLARRIIVVNEGGIVYDGLLEDLTNRFATEKLIKATLSSEGDTKQLDNIGIVKRYSFPEVVISVPRSTIAVAAAELLQNFPVTDLTIEEVPIEEIIRKVFKGEL